MDWAEKIALEIILPHVECEIETEETCKRLCSALRNAKADGLKEAMKIVDDLHGKAARNLAQSSTEARTKAWAAKGMAFFEARFFIKEKLFEMDPQASAAAIEKVE